MSIYKINDYTDAFRKKIDLTAKKDKAVKMYNSTKE